MVSWLKTKAMSLESQEEVKEFIDKRDVAVVGLFTDKKSDKLLEAFISAADSIDDIGFGIITDTRFSGE